MSVDDAVTTPSRYPALRVVRDAHRPSITSAEAARRIGRSRFWVTEQLQNGGIEGYGVKGEHRTRWYVYSDALPLTGQVDGDASPSHSGLIPHLGLLVRELMEAVHDERRQRADAFGEVYGALDEMARSAVVAREGATQDSLDHDIEAQQIAAQGRDRDRAAQQAAERTNRLLFELGTRLARQA